MEKQEIGIEFLKALNRYFTPVAFLVVLSALFAQPPQPVFVASIVLMISSLAFNAVSAVYVKDHPTSWRQVGYLRVAGNFAFNALSYILLHDYWPFVWVLFALGPIAMAFYGDVAETFLVLGGIGGVMMGCLWFEGEHDPRVWGETGLQLFFILLVSLFLIRVAQLIRHEREARR